MARTLKNGIDYFPMDVVSDDRMELLEAKFGIVGFGVFIHLCQRIYSNGYYLEWNDEKALLFKKSTGVEIDLVEDILKDCFRWKIFDLNLYEKHQILTSRAIQETYIEATQRRKQLRFYEEFILIPDLKSKYSEVTLFEFVSFSNNEEIEIPLNSEENFPIQEIASFIEQTENETFLCDEPSKGEPDININSLQDNKCEPNVNINSQSKVKERESKLNESKLNERETPQARGGVLSLSPGQRLFCEKFPKRRIDADLEPGQDMICFLDKISKSTFLTSPKTDNLSLKWFKNHYDVIMSGAYSDFEKREILPKLKNARTYSKEDYAKIMKSIDEIEI